jgi:aquaporin Z
MWSALKQHWPEYLIEAVCLGLFMVSACAFGILFEYPGSPVHQALPNVFFRRALTGLAMGATAVALIFSPMGKRSGAHMNPSVTLTFFRLGKVAPWDAFFYTAFQFLGGLAGVLLVAGVARESLRHPAVNYVATLPGTPGIRAAFLGELAISFLLMTVVLQGSNRRVLTRFTGLFAGALIAVYITIEAPLSGMSMNPARTFGSAYWAHAWTALWIYFTAPPLGMLLAAELYLLLRGARQIYCAKFHHVNNQRCIFRCNFAALGSQT